MTHHASDLNFGLVCKFVMKIARWLKECRHGHERIRYTSRWAVSSCIGVVKQKKAQRNEGGTNAVIPIC